MATNDEINRWLLRANKYGYNYGDLGHAQIAQLLDAGLLVAPPAPPPEVTFRSRACRYDHESIYIPGPDVGIATIGKGFRPGATLEVTVRQVD